MKLFSKLPMLLTTCSLALSGIVLSGCGKDSDNKPKKDRDVTRPTVTAETPVTYAIYDEDCIRQDDPVTINRTGIWGWEGLSVVNATAELNDTVTAQSLESSIVSGTTFDRLYLRVCNGPSELNCVKENGDPKGWDLPREKNRLRVCEDDFTYPRETFEAGALTSIHYLNNAAGAYQKAMGTTLPKVHLEVFPLFESRFSGRTDDNGNKVNVREYIVDNLAYYPGHNLIVVFPQSQSALAAGYDKFWESSFVLAHELGHHVEQVHVGTELESLGMYWDPMLHAYRGLVGEGSEDSERMSRLARFWTSVSESFADLNAYYAGGEDVASLVNVDCLGANRNLKAKVFADDQTAKILDVSVVSQLLAGSNQVNYCNGVNLSEPHTVGAIVAHNVLKIIEILEPAAGGEPNAKVIQARYRRSVEWIKAMVAAQKIMKNRDYTSATLFAPLGRAIEALGRSASDAQKGQICELAGEMLPVLSPTPFADYCQGF